MSATTVDPRPKGQGNKVQNGSMHQKDGVNDDDFEPYLSGQTNQSNNYPPMSDPYMPSYYAPSIGFPYSLGEAAWSTAGDPPMPYLTTYGQMSNGEPHFIPDGVFGQPGALGNTPPFLGQHGFNFFPSSADFSTWGSSVTQGQSTQQQTSVYSSSYGYGPSSLGRAIADGQAGFGGGGGGGSDTQLSKVPVLSSIEQGMPGLKLGADMVAAATKTVGSPLAAAAAAAGMSSMAAMNAIPQSVSSAAPKPASWAAIARKPAKPQPKVKPKAGMAMGCGAAIPPPPIKHNMNIGTWDDKGPLGKGPMGQAMMGPQTVVQQQPLMAQHQPLLPPQHPHPHPHAHPHPHPHQHQHQHQHQAYHLQSLQSPQHPQALPPGPPHPHPHAHLSSQAGPPQALHPHHPQQQQQQHHHHHPQQHHQHQQGPPPNRWVAPRNRGAAFNQGPGAEGFAGLGGGGGGAAMGPPCGPGGGGGGGGGGCGEVHPVLEKLRALNNYNPKDFEWSLKNGRVFIIKSYSEDDIHRSIKYSIWCSTEHGNKRLDGAYRSLAGKGPLYLLFSVNGSGHFCGVAEMRSPVDYGAYAGVWSQDKWKGKFEVRWAFVKDVPNNQLRHIRLENNDNKPVTNSRDTQEVPLEKAKQVLRIIATFKHTTSIFDDFAHYESRQEEEEAMRRERNRNKQ